MLCSEVERQGEEGRLFTSTSTTSGTRPEEHPRPPPHPTPHVTRVRKLRVNQLRVRPGVARSDISRAAPRPFVNAICLIAAYQYTDETRWLAGATQGRPFMLTSARL